MVLSYVYGIRIDKKIVFVGVSRAQKTCKVKQGFLKRFGEKLKALKIDGHIPEFRILETFELQGTKMQNILIGKQILDKYVDEYDPILNDVSLLFPEEKLQRLQRLEKQSQSMYALHELMKVRRANAKVETAKTEGETDAGPLSS